jgi:hypothetical protein
MDHCVATEEHGAEEITQVVEITEVEEVAGEVPATAEPRVPSLPARLRALGRRLRPYGPALVVSGILGILAIRTIVSEAGRPALPLDDAFIHLQYARRLAEGGFFSYVAGEGYTSGATSLLWPIVIAPFCLLGLRDLSILYVLWFFGWIAHAALAVETARVAQRLAGTWAAVGAGAMCLGFGAFTWFAWSGMETIPFAWVLMRTVRVAAEFADPHREPAAGRPRAAELVGLGVVAPLLRPEGMLVSLIASAAFVAGARHGQAALQKWARLLLVPAPLIGALIPLALHVGLAGHATSSPAMVKWLLVNPTHSRPQTWDAVLANLEQLAMSLHRGGDWTAIFLPQGAAVVLGLGLVALVVTAARRRAFYHAAFTLVIALGSLLPCTYLNVLGDRVRYVWPFAGAWFVLLACLARELGDLGRRYAGKAAFAAPVAAGMVAGVLSTHLDWTIRDLAQSSSAVDRQQVTLGRWAAEHLPPDARIGVHDAGAIAYFSHKKTFDVTGVTTEGEAPYWVEGPGSRYEHYEKLPRGRLPTHFIVYPDWMACPPVLGNQLFQASVIDQSILGGATMVVFEARYATLGSGALPVGLKVQGRLLDEIDISDLESEASHGYDARGASDQDNRAVLHEAPTGSGSDAAQAEGLISDGGRFRRRVDRFFAHLGAARPVMLVMRVGSEKGVELSVRITAGSSGDATSLEIPAGMWVERAIAMPPSGARTPIEVSTRGDGSFQSFHYWVYESPNAPGASPPN